MRMSVIELSDALHAMHRGADSLIDGVSIDTRTLMPGNVYIALHGENLDGHDFVKEAQARGAAAAIVDHYVEGILMPQILVNDTQEALRQLALNWRCVNPSHVIGVTGSNGKTTVKNCIYSVLLAACGGDAHKVLATQGNLNNHIGLPLMVLRMDIEHSYTVLEMGMNHFGEIAYLTKIARPNVAVITNAFPCHLEGVGDLDGVAKAKAEILKGLPEDGFAILNYDDPYFSYWKERVSDAQCVSFGVKSGADIVAKNIVSGATEQAFTLVTPKGSIPIVISLLGEHNVRNALAAAAACFVLGVDLNVIQEGLKNVAPEDGRMQTHTLSSGAKIIDDAYNANPASTRAAIEHLSSLSGKKILAFADMRELGADEIKYHAAIGEFAREKGIDALLAYGELARHAVKAFGRNGMHFSTKAELIEAVKKEVLQSNVVVLAKGSNSMGLRDLVKVVLDE